MKVDGWMGGLGRVRSVVTAVVGLQKVLGREEVQRNPLETRSRQWQVAALVGDIPQQCSAFTRRE